MDSYGIYNVNRSCSIVAVLSLLLACEGSIHIAGIYIYMYLIFSKFDMINYMLWTFILHCLYILGQLIHQYVDHYQKAPKVPFNPQEIDKWLSNFKYFNNMHQHVYFITIQHFKIKININPLQQKKGISMKKTRMQWKYWITLWTNQKNCKNF